MSSDRTNLPAAASEPAPGVNDDTAQTGSSLSAAPLGAENHDLSESAAPTRTIEELTISELLMLLWRSPASTMRRFQQAASMTHGRQHSVTVQPRAANATQADLSRDVSILATLKAAPQLLLRADRPRLAIYLFAYLSALIGSNFARGTAEITRSGGYSLDVAAPYLWLGFLLWLLGDIYGHRQQIRAYWQNCERARRLLWFARLVPAVILVSSLFRLAQSMSAPVEAAVDIALSALVSTDGRLRCIACHQHGIPARTIAERCVRQPAIPGKRTDLDCRPPACASACLATNQPMAKVPGNTGIRYQPCRMGQHQRKPHRAANYVGLAG